MFAALLAGCAADPHRVIAPGMTSAEVNARAGAPTIVGRLPNGDAYWDYSRQPDYTDRVSYGPDDRVREVRNLLTEDNFRALRPGMTPAEVLATLGPSYIKNSFANGTTAWTYRFQDVGIWKLLHVLFDPSGRLQRYEVEWDPNIYSKKNGGQR